MHERTSWLYAFREIRSYWRLSYLRSPLAGWRAALRGTWLELSAVLGVRVRCFGGCGRRVHWDPIVGAYCAACLDHMLNTEPDPDRVTVGPWPRHVA